MSWAVIKGQKRVLALLRHAIERKRLPHAYLFLGPEGIGKKLTALTLAQALNCSEQDTDFSCNSCHKISNGTHPDVIVIEPQETGNIKIEEIRQLQEQICYKPFEGRYKIWIIDQAQGLTPQAANCLLKTLEEPPENSIIILIASQPELLLPTVISRCQQVQFERLTPPVLKSLLREQGIAPDSLEMAVALADGGLSKVNREKLDDFYAWREEMLDYLQGQKNTFADVFALGTKLAKNKNQIGQLIQLFNLWYRDLLVLKLGLNTASLVNQDKCSQLHEQAAGLGLPLIQQRLGIIQESFSALGYNANPRMVLENILLKLNPNNKEELQNEITQA